jgi:hypothetical protein
VNLSTPNVPAHSPSLMGQVRDNQHMPDGLHKPVLTHIWPVLGNKFVYFHRSSFLANSFLSHYAQIG